MSQRGRRIAVAVLDAAPAQPAVRVPRPRMCASDFAEVAARIQRVMTVNLSARRTTAASVMAAAAASQFNTLTPDASRVLLLAQGQLSVFGVVREEVAAQLRQIANERDSQHAALVAEHFPLLG